MAVAPGAPQVPGFNNHQPQYAYAIGAIGIVLLYMAVSIGLRYRACNGGNLEKRSLASFAVAELIVLGFGGCPLCCDCSLVLHCGPLCHYAAGRVCAGFALFGVTVSYIVLATILFLPFLVVSLLVLYSTWVKDDFEWFVAGGFWNPFSRAEPQEAIVTSATPGTPQHQQQQQQQQEGVASIRSKRRRNTMVLLGFLVAAGCLVAFALLSGVGFQRSWVGWVISGGVFTAIVSLFATVEVCVCRKREVRAFPPLPRCHGLRFTSRSGSTRCISHPP